MTEADMPSMHRLAAVLCAAALLAGLGRTVRAADDWPCTQPKVATLSPGQMWAGPPLDQALAHWQDDPAVAALVPKLVARRTSMDEASQEISRFADAAGADKDKRLTLLFAGIFDRINAERSRIIAGIERYARKQKALADRIRQEEAASHGPASRAQSATVAGTPAADDPATRLRWDTRIYDERAQALTYVCETPVVLEQRAFALARDIQSHLE